MRILPRISHAPGDLRGPCDLRVRLGVIKTREQLSGELRAEQKNIEGTVYTTHRHAYDADGNDAAITYPSNRTFLYTFDYAGRPVSVTTAGVTNPLVSGARYLPFGPLTEFTYGSGDKKVMAYDFRYRPPRHPHPPDQRHRRHHLAPRAGALRPPLPHPHRLRIRPTPPPPRPGTGRRQQRELQRLPLVPQLVGAVHAGGSSRSCCDRPSLQIHEQQSNQMDGSKGSLLGRATQRSAVGGNQSRDFRPVSANKRTSSMLRPGTGTSIDELLERS
ncbi:MAG: hypothetical protein QOH21_1178 [Acidobacteriota bacterium]|nr:hypothetical protein [Acidobacteriota bacterium]